MNMKRINEVPVIEELGENSYVLVDNNGEAARIPGSKVGGGGGSYLDLLWGVPDEEFIYISVCRENDISTILDFETGSVKLFNDRAIRYMDFGVEYLDVIRSMEINPQQKMIIDYSTGGTTYIFSDTVLGEE